MTQWPQPGELREHRQTNALSATDFSSGVSLVHRVAWSERHALVHYPSQGRQWTWHGLRVCDFFGLGSLASSSPPPSRPLGCSQAPAARPPDSPGAAHSPGLSAQTPYWRDCEGFIFPLEEGPGSSPFGWRLVSLSRHTADVAVERTASAATLGWFGPARTWLSATSEPTIRKILAFTLSCVLGPVRTACPAGSLPLRHARKEPTAD